MIHYHQQEYAFAIENSISWVY